MLYNLPGWVSSEKTIVFLLLSLSFSPASQPPCSEEFRPYTEAVCNCSRPQYQLTSQPTSSLISRNVSEEDLARHCLTATRVDPK